MIKLSNIIKSFVAISAIIIYAAPISAQSVGLVLSGGGAKGIAHIGVIQALEDNGIPIDYVAGTSMGSIVGGLYAAGYSPSEMMQLIESKGFADWSTGTISQQYTDYFASPSKTAALFYINLEKSDSSMRVVAPLIQGSLINPLPMNFAFMELFAPYTAQCNGEFNRLFVPFRCVASNVYAKHKVVFSKGDLGDAIRASMSFPFVFQPPIINGTPLYDGGIYDNFPIDVMQSEFAPAFMLGIDVSTSSESSQRNTLNELEAMIIQPQNDSIAAVEGMKIHINLHEFSLLDFPKCREIYKIGYDKAMLYIDSIKARVHRRVSAENVALKRNIFKSGTPSLAFDSVKVSGGTPQQNRYVQYLFNNRSDSDTLSVDNARLDYYQAISTGKIRNLVPHASFNPESRLFNLDMNLSAKYKYSLGAGGYITSSTNSMIYLCAKYSTLSFNAFDADLSGWIGQSYYALQANTKLSLHTHIPSQIAAEVVVSRNKFYESDVLFYKESTPSFILSYEYFVKAYYEMALGRKARASIGIGYGHLRDKFFSSNDLDFANTEQNLNKQNLAQVFIKADGNSLNYINYPTRGHSWEVGITGVTGNYEYMPKGVVYNGYANQKWIQIHARGEQYQHLASHFTLGYKGEVMASTKKLYDDYNLSIVEATAFAPTPSTKSYFNTAFRANSYVAAGIVPIAEISQNLQLRTEGYLFLPMRKIEEDINHKSRYGGWFKNPEWLAQMSVVYSFPFASLCVYGNYLSYPSKNWNFGISFGILLPANRFL